MRIDRQLQEDDALRRRRVLSLLLASISVLAACAVIDVVYHRYVMPRDGGDTLEFELALLVIFVALWFANRFGHTKKAAAAFLLIFYAVLLHSMIEFGAAMPAALLACALLITIAIATMGTIAGIVVTAACVAGMWAVGLSEHAAGILPYWKTNVTDVSDLAVYAIILCVGAFFSWFSSREITRSLARAYQSEAALRAERDNLEKTVEERTHAWKEAELGRSTELARLAEFGKLSAGMVHDLLNPLTAVSLSMHALGGESVSQAEVVQSIDAAMRAAKRIESHIALIRKHLRPQRMISVFDARDELRNIVSVLSHIAKGKRVELRLDAETPLPLKGDALAFYQAYTNIILNAIEAFNAAPASPARVVHISASCNDSGYRITVEDNGDGMSDETQTKLFDPFFTTKPEGIGLGLSVTKDAIAGFKGAIAYERRTGGGTICRTFIPLKEQETNG